jgi:N-acetylglucosamine-6-phosphate deacetylase
MSPLGNREPGMVGAALDDERVTAGIIVDGRHVSPATLRIALRARSPEAFMLVTDAMPTVGGGNDFVLQGKHIRVENGVCVDDSGTLAGSDLDMARAVRNTVELLGVSLEQALYMAAAVPSRFLSLEDRYGTIRTGMRANLLRLTPDLAVSATWIDGVVGVQGAERTGSGPGACDRDGRRSGHSAYEVQKSGSEQSGTSR